MAKRIPLTDMRNGEIATVVEVLGGKGVQNRLRALGIRDGVNVTRINGAFAHGPVVLQVGGTQTALGFGISYKIIVEADR